MRQWLGAGAAPANIKSEAPAGPMRAPHLAVDDFLPANEAQRLRKDVDAHFADPHKHQADRHQIWNYWHVPQLYTYLRTAPEKVIDRESLVRFHETLTGWARRTLGLAHVTWPYLSLYVDGCVQGLHNDSTNGRFGYVYSLTFDDRRSRGGETIVLREGDLFRTNLANAAAGRGLYDLIAPNFNRLAIFDDRMPHGVQRVEGSMDPAECRIVLHGHIGEGGAFATGPVPAAIVSTAVKAAVAETLAGTDGADNLHGPLTVRLDIAPSGEMRDAWILVDRLARPDGACTRTFADGLMERIGALRFDAGEGVTEATVPIIFGGSLTRD